MSKLQISLAAARVNAGMTQKQVAEKMHISNQTVVNWESGKTTPRFAQLAMLCQLYSVSQNDICLPNS